MGWTTRQKDDFSRQIQFINKEYQAQKKRITAERDKKIFDIIKKVEARHLEKIRSSLR